MKFTSCKYAMIDAMHLQSGRRRVLRVFLAATVAAMPLCGLSETASAPNLSFDVNEGGSLNSFLRVGPIAAHLVLRSGSDPRLMVAFPAGNSGVGLWFAHSERPMSWNLLGRPQPVRAKDERGRPLFGLTAEVSVTGAPDLAIKQAVLSSVRVLRDYQSLGTYPPELAVSPTIQNSTITWARDRLDGAAGYRLSLEVTRGTLEAGHVAPASNGSIAFKIRALSGEAPLTPLPEAQLLDDQAAADPAARHTLTFLSYREKFLAGSWRFNTYFGRDTLMSVRLLMRALDPEAVQAGLGAVLTRLSSRGEVAHEEDIGEFAILDHLRAGEPKSDAPVYDYKMIDGSFMLAPVAAEWLLDDERGRSHAAQFLARMDSRTAEAPRSFGADLAANLEFVLHAAAAFADDPRAANLIGLKPGSQVGQWRDSNTGLAGGRFPYDVNAVFAPAALQAAARLLGSGLLDPYLEPQDQEILARAGAMADIWRAKAAPLFDVNVASAVARSAITRYAAAVGVSDTAALHSVGQSAVQFHAIALSADATVIPIVHSDEGFELLFGRPSPAALRRCVAAMMRPFPAGLLTDVGVVVANPVFAAAPVQNEFTRNAYHGTVVWSWQQAVLAAGLERQLRRTDLPSQVKQLLRGAETQLWDVIRASNALRNSELWSWTFAAGHFHLAPFGANARDADESNAAQLWSTVYLALPDPAFVRNAAR
jgi:hypothetical protein